MKYCRCEPAGWRGRVRVADVVTTQFDLRHQFGGVQMGHTAIIQRLANNTSCGVGRVAILYVSVR